MKSALVMWRKPNYLFELDELKGVAVVRPLLRHQKFKYSLVNIVQAPHKELCWTQFYSQHAANLKSVSVDIKPCEDEKVGTDTQLVQTFGTLEQVLSHIEGRPWVQDKCGSRSPRNVDSQFECKGLGPAIDLTKSGIKLLQELPASIREAVLVFIEEQQRNPDNWAPLVS